MLFRSWDVTNFAMLGVVPLCCVAWSLLTRDAEQLPRTVGRSSRGLDAECAASALLIADAMPNSQGGDPVASEKGEPTFRCRV